ncbi:MAG: NAD(P)-binding protein [Dehalococcoidia bacterium]|nr:NAD(P)-binding protein [Dehalococcoidia bacterium]
MDSSNWDVVVVGSGLGGLTAAAYLAALGRRVAVLEQHYVAGGNAHVFRRMKKFEFDVGVHYVGDCGPNGGVTQAFRGLGLDTKIEWVELDPDGFDTLIFPGLTFKVPASWDLYRERLVAAFPDDESAIHSCIDILQAVNQQQGKIKLPVDQADLPRLMQEAPAFLQWGMRTLGDLFEACGVGQRLAPSSPPSAATTPRRLRARPSPSTPACSTATSRAPTTRAEAGRYCPRTWWM